MSALVEDDMTFLKKILNVLLFLVCLFAALAGPLFMIVRGLEFKVPLPFLLIVAVLVILLPPALSVGTVILYKDHYERKNSRKKNKVDLNKAVDFSRYSKQLILLNILALLFLGYFIGADIRAAGIPGVRLGAFSIPLALGDEEIGVSTSLFYLAYAGFGIYYFEAVRRRFASYSLVPSFYVSLSFKWLYVSIAIVIIHMALELGSELFSFSAGIAGTIDKPESRLLIAFLVGIFPEEWINLVAAKVRGWFGIASAETLPLSLIEGIDYTMEAFLNDDANIDSIRTLANLTEEEIGNLEGINKEVVRDWQKQAKLYNAVNDKIIIERLRRIAINDIEDLKLLTEIKLAEDKIPEKNLTSILTEEDINKARAKPEYWSVLIRVLKQEHDSYMKTKNPQKSSASRKPA